MDIAHPSMPNLSVPAPLAQEWEQLLTRAREGALPLPELMDRGNFFQGGNGLSGTVAWCGVAVNFGASE